MKDVVFVTYTHPRQQSESRYRTLVARHIGVHFRNRSKPTRRRPEPRELTDVVDGNLSNDTTNDDNDKILISARENQSSSYREQYNPWKHHEVPVTSRETTTRFDQPLPTNNQLQTTTLLSCPSNKVFGHFGISGREADIVSWYLNEVPSMAYGTTGRGLFCPGRDIAWFATIACPQAINWSLIDAEGYVIANQPPGCDCTALVHRRTIRKVQAYATLRKMLEDPVSQCSDETLTLVCAAIAIEARFFDRQATRAHVKGLNLLIAKRGGVRSMLTSTVTFGHPLAGIGFLLLAELEVSTRQELYQTTSRVLAQLIEMQNHSHVMLSLHPVVQMHPQIRKLLDPNAKLSLLPKQLARFVTLYTLNLIVFEYGRVGADCSNFVSRLNELIDGSMAIDPITKLPLVREEILTWIMAKSWADVETLLPSDKSWQEREVHITESAIDALKIWSRLRETTKAKVIQALYSWLFRNDLPMLEKPILLIQAELDEIKSDAMSSYYEDYVRESA